MIKQTTANITNKITPIKLAHLPQLDSLRTVAVFLVLLAHFLPTIGLMLPFSWYGVDIFFTISGFLITTILLNSLHNNGGKHRGMIIKNFMIRRAFRLFPLYYLFIIFFWVLKNHFNIWLWKDEFTPYFFTYTPNWLLFQIGLENGSCFSHLWSLGVEEQFYLIWPWVILFVPSKYTIDAIVFFILVSFVIIIFNDDNAFRLLPFGDFHTLCMGALLALFYFKNNTVMEWLAKNRILIFLLSFLNLVVVLYLFQEKGQIGFLYRGFSVCICTTAFVLCSIYGWTGIVGKFADHKAVQYLGRISYGIYLFHLPVPALLAIVLTRFQLHISEYILFFVYIAVTVLLAAFSYRFIEMPFLRLKQRFE